MQTCAWRHILNRVRRLNIILMDTLHFYANSSAIERAENRTFHEPSSGDQSALVSRVKIY